MITILLNNLWRSSKWMPVQTDIFHILSYSSNRECQHYGVHSRNKFGFLYHPLHIELALCSSFCLFIDLFLLQHISMDGWLIFWRNFIIMKAPLWSNCIYLQLWSIFLWFSSFSPEMSIPPYAWSLFDSFGLFSTFTQFLNIFNCR